MLFAKILCDSVYLSGIFYATGYKDVERFAAHTAVTSLVK